MAGGLAAIGALSGGLAQGLTQGQQNALAAIQAAALKASQSSANAAANALQSYQGGPSAGGGLSSIGAMPQAPTPAPTQPQGMFQPSMSQPYTGASSGFQDALKFTLGQEGGLNPADTNGTPTNLGINQQANPDVNVSQLTPETAAPIYKQRYWDAIDGDKLPPAIQKMAFDTAVMSGPQVAKAMLQQSGGDPQKFMAIRQAFQSKLLAAEPDKYGKYSQAWAKRNAALGGQSAPQMGAPGASQGGTPGGSGGVPSIAALQSMPLQDIVSLVKRANPDLKGAALLGAVQDIQGVMNPEAQMQLKALSEQLRLLQIQQQGFLGQERIVTTQRGQDLSHEDKEAGLSEKASEFKTRQAATTERFNATLDEKVKALQQAKDVSERRNIVNQARDAIRDQLAAERAQISAANVIGPERDALMKEAKERAEDAQERLDAAMKIKAESDKSESADTGPKASGSDGEAGGRSSKGASSEAAGPVGSVMIGPDGKKYWFKGGDWDAQESWEVVK